MSGRTQLVITVVYLPTVGCVDGISKLTLTDIEEWD